MEQRSHDVLDAAARLGIRYVDAARGYGRAEDFLSSWMKRRGAEGLLVGSKWRRAILLAAVIEKGGILDLAPEPDQERDAKDLNVNPQVDTKGEPHEVKDHSLDHFLRQKAETLELLGSQLRLYQIHSATLASGVLEDQAVLDALAAFKAETDCRLGLSLSGAGQADTLRRAVEVGIFDCVQATWNLYEQSVAEALCEARRAGMEVIIKEAMANGRLLRDERLSAAAEALNAPKDAVALVACMVQPFQPMVLSGAVTVAQLESNAVALELLQRCREDEAAMQLLLDLTAQMRTDAAAYWAERSALAWN
eukprot:scaffold2663_cov256-Pinguiococcus_pyrenoidosus.AAC.21